LLIGQNVIVTQLCDTVQIIMLQIVSDCMEHSIWRCLQPTQKHHTWRELTQFSMLCKNEILSFHYDSVSKNSEHLGSVTADTTLSYALKQFKESLYIHKDFILMLQTVHIEKSKKQKQYIKTVW